MDGTGVVFVGAARKVLDRTGLGATGAILAVKALYELKRTGGKYALVSMCIGGGQGIAAVIEGLHH